jgi:hypothetical protein
MVSITPADNHIGYPASLHLSPWDCCCAKCRDLQMPPLQSSCSPAKPVYSRKPTATIEAKHTDKHVSMSFLINSQLAMIPASQKRECHDKNKMPYLNLYAMHMDVQCQCLGSHFLVFAWAHIGCMRLASLQVTCLEACGGSLSKEHKYMAEQHDPCISIFLMHLPEHMACSC